MIFEVFEECCFVQNDLVVYVERSYGSVLANKSLLEVNIVLFMLLKVGYQVLQLFWHKFWGSPSSGENVM